MINYWIFQSNPKYFDLAKQLNDSTCIESDWSVNQHANEIKKGDYAFLWIAGKDQGIYAIVELISDPYPKDVDPGASWADSTKPLMVDYRYVQKILPPLLESEIKKIEGLPKLSIMRQYNGTNFPVTKSQWDLLSKDIERRKTGELRHTIEQDILSDMDESEEETIAKEGKVVNYYGKRYERNMENRLSAIKHQGTLCSVCGFDFFQTYGDRGQGFIEVHHKKPISTFEHEIPVNPKDDLIPVCANCHRMIHRDRNNVLTIEEMKKILKKT